MYEDVAVHNDFFPLDWLGWPSITRQPTLGELSLTHLLSRRQQVAVLICHSLSYWLLTVTL